MSWEPQVTDLRVDNLVEPLGLGNFRPEFSWRVTGSIGQIAAEVEVGPSAEFAAGTRCWTSGKVVGTRPFGLRYAGPPLPARQQMYWRVRVWRADGTETGWSAPTRFETGMGAAQWCARWITGPDVTAPATLYLRTELSLPGRVVRARAYASALGWYRLVINGLDLTAPALVPRWTPFQDYVEYQTYDATAALRPGANVVGIVVSEGRFRGKLGGLSRPARYGDQLAAIAHLDIELADGQQITIGTDESWTTARGPIRWSDPKHGERVDLRIPDPLCAPPADALPGGAVARVLAPHRRRLIAEEVERVTEVARLPATVSRTRAGVVLVDFGQNFSGVVSILLNGAAGDRIVLSYSEVLTPAGELDTTYLGDRDPARWFQRDEIILAGAPVRYRPAFTIHGFRYLAVEGLSGELCAADVEGIVLSTALTETGRFSCSNPVLERLHANVEWSMLSNFTDTPSDCPTRERSGWTGDIQVFASTAAILAGVRPYLRRYLGNLAAEQLPDGRVPVVIPSESAPDRIGLPERLFRVLSSSTGWGDASVILPWTLYWYYGDEDILGRQYISAQAWVDHLTRRAATRRGLARRLRCGVGAQEQFILDSGFHFGEWLRPGEALTAQLRDAVFAPRPAVATAYLAHSTRLLSRIADVLGEAGDAERYTLLADRIRDAWNAAFVRVEGARIGDDNQDDYVRALAFELLPPDRRAAAVARLVELIEAADGHLGTGFLSTAMLLPTLSRNGRSDIAYRVLHQTSAPSWRAQIQRGATTIWETWEGYDPAGKARRSHNHYALGAVAAWLHEDVAGLRPAAPGYARIRIDPTVGGELTWASSVLDTPYGRASSTWRIDQSGLDLAVEVPPGTIAEVVLPTGGMAEVGGGAHEWHWPPTP
ncbi:alpha-L-rhamnosidase [Nocardia mexicana]|uniref:alpha-L-rhamnosidase n=1 Tax=Nocardia mexicana TaxID=279262 RepID=A0A370GMU3_9NOCA|nr:alpha-L-rhamnosidase [Nocardia mexicana]RDI44619.1 alpha-L-rhamnosidase [Nocardia mexicana]